ncbi:hypothetical protein [Neptuniibacter sp. QD34_54]|uniref:hypothetical protein n=1 Tax=Neptuniibacter sp. QD34_54 TaxID=3398208 RepID=UPI0039F5E162
MIRQTFTTALAAGLLTALPAQAETYFELSGKATADLRLFTQSAQFTGQDYDTNLSFSFEPELYWEWNDGADSLTFTPFLRLDENDSERTHGDIRELSWVHVSDDWELRTGLRKVFWGVTEFQHLVDVINQTDGVEDFDGEDKLGQQMINLSLVKDWGIIDLYLLPGFRERTFASTDGRLRAGLVIDTDRATFESSAGNKHIDTAIRWSHTIGDFDLGAYWFRGTNRDPKLQVQSVNGQTILVPHYEQMNQIGFDLQATLDNWLWKLETIHRDTKSENYWAAQGGFEYTFYGIQDSSADIGVLLEYGWDKRGKSADAAIQNDVFMGARLTLNDTQSTEVLAGIGHDLDYHSNSMIVEASRRFGDNWKLSLDGRFFSADNPADLSYSLNKDDHLQLTVERYF